MPLSKQRHKGPVADYSETSGAGAKLAKAIGKNPQAPVARQLQISPAFLNHLIHGRKAPGLKVAIRIHDMFGIPVGAWV